MLSILEVPFAIFQETFEYFINNKQAKTAYEFMLISKMQE